VDGKSFVRVVALAFLVAYSLPALARPTIEEIKARNFLDDYESNILWGYNIVMQTERYAARYSGNHLRSTNCHLNGGIKPNAYPLNVAGLYPKWRAKNGVSNGELSLQSRLPVITASNLIVRAGALLSYGPDVPAGWKRSAY